MKNRIFPLLLSLLLFLGNQAVQAQCAMCKANAENAARDNSGVAEGLNTGIVYLMAIPYLLFLVVGIVFYRKKIVAFFKS
jgi:hypothetical protein